MFPPDTKGNVLGTASKHFPEGHLSWDKTNKLFLLLDLMNISTARGEDGKLLLISASGLGTQTNISTKDTQAIGTILEPSQGADSEAGVGELLTVGRQCICSSSVQVVCLWDAPTTLFTDWRYFYLNLLLEVIFSSYKLYHQVFTSWQHQRETRASVISLLSFRESCIFFRVPFRVNSLLHSLGKRQVLPDGLGPRLWAGNLYCSFLSKGGRVFFLLVIAEFLDSLFQDWK